MVWEIGRRAIAWGYPRAARSSCWRSTSASPSSSSCGCGRPPFPTPPSPCCGCSPGLLGTRLGCRRGVAPPTRCARSLCSSAMGMLVRRRRPRVSVGGQGQLVSGFYLAVLGMYSGYFFSARVVTPAHRPGHGDLRRCASSSNWRLDSPAYVIAVVVLDGRRDAGRLVTGPAAEVAGHPRPPHGTAEPARAGRQLRMACTPWTPAGRARRRSSCSTSTGSRSSTTRVAMTPAIGCWSTSRRTGPASCGASDLLARTGGDEFVFVLPATAEGGGGAGRTHEGGQRLRLVGRRRRMAARGVVRDGRAERRHRDVPAQGVIPVGAAVGAGRWSCPVKPARTLPSATVH